MKQIELNHKRVVAYVRISQDTQDRGSRNQEEVIQRYADRNGFSIQQWYKDNEGVNPRGDGFKRPQFQRMYRDAQARKFDAVLCDYQERLGLLAHHFSYWVVEFSKESVSLWDAQGRNLSSADPATFEKTARDSVASGAWLFKQGRKTLEARIASGQAGDYHGGVPPYYCDIACYDAGLSRIKYRLVYHNRTEKTQYIYDEKGNVVDTRLYSGGHCPHKDRGDRLRCTPTIQSDKLETTRQIFHWFNTECINLTQIAGRLNTAQIPAYYCKYWTTNGVKSFMLNPAVIGKPAQCKVSASRYVERYDNGTIDQRPDHLISVKRMACLSNGITRNSPEKWEMPDAPIFDPIIPEDVFWSVYHKITERRRGGCKPSRNAIAWLKGFAYCSNCGCPLHFNDRRIKAKGKQFRYVPSYRCGTYQSKGAKANPFGCRANFVKASVLEEVVEYYLTATQLGQFTEQVESVKPQTKIECVPPSFDSPDPQLRERIQEEIQTFQGDNERIWETAKQLNSDFARKRAGEQMRENERQIAERELDLKRLDEQLTPEEWKRRVDDALSAIKEGTCRAKKESLSKVLERIDCEIEYVRDGVKRYRLASVKFVPVIASADDAVLLGKQWRGLADNLEKDGVKITGNVRWKSETQIIGAVGKPVKMSAEIELSVNP